MKTALDDDLRERWASAAAGAVVLAAARTELEQRLGADDGSALARSHVGRARQRLSEACRFSGLLDESLEHKDAAIAIWRAQNKRRACFLVRLQRALVMAELDDPMAAAQMHELDHEMRGDPELEPYYRDFWLEYEARRALWTGDRLAAEALLGEALLIRKLSRNARIVVWTQSALDKLQRGDESV